MDTYNINLLKKKAKLGKQFTSTIIHYECIKNDKDYHFRIEFSNSLEIKFQAIFNDNNSLMKYCIYMHYNGKQESIILHMDSNYNNNINKTDYFLEPSCKSNSKKKYLCSTYDFNIMFKTINNILEIKKNKNFKNLFNYCLKKLTNYDGFDF